MEIYIHSTFDNLNKDCDFHTEILSFFTFCSIQPSTLLHLMGDFPYAGRVKGGLFHTHELFFHFSACAPPVFGKSRNLLPECVS
jgi:hypothetical protein